MGHNYEFKLGQIKASDANKFLDDLQKDKGGTSYEDISAFIKNDANKIDNNDKEVQKLFSQMDKEQYNKLSNLDGKEGLSSNDISIFAKMDGSKDSISLSDSIILNSQDMPECQGLNNSFKKKLGSNLNKFEEKYFDYMAPDSDKNYDKKIDENVDLSPIRKAKIAPSTLEMDGNFSIDIPKSENFYSRYYSDSNAVSEIEKIDENHSIQDPKSATPILIDESNSKNLMVKYDASPNINSSKDILVKGESHRVLSESEEDSSAEQEKKYYVDGKLEQKKYIDYNKNTVSEIKYNSDGSISSKTDSVLGDIPLAPGERTYTIIKSTVEKDGHKKQYEIIPFVSYDQYDSYKNKDGGYYNLKTIDDKKNNGDEVYVRKKNNDFVELNEAKEQAQLKLSGKKEAYKPITAQINGKEETVLCDPDSVIGKSAQWAKDVIDGKIKTVDKNGKEVPLKEVKDIFALNGGFNYEEVFLEIKKAQEQGISFDNLTADNALAEAGEHITFDVAFCLDSSKGYILQTFIHEAGHKAYARHYATQKEMGTTSAADYSQKEEADVHLLGNLCRLSKNKEKLELKDLQEAKNSSNNLASGPTYSGVQLYSKLQSSEKRNPLLEKENP